MKYTIFLLAVASISAALPIGNGKIKSPASEKLGGDVGEIVKFNSPVSGNTGKYIIGTGAAGDFVMGPMTTQKASFVVPVGIKYV